MTTTLDGKIKARLPSTDGRRARAGVGPVTGAETAHAAADTTQAIASKGNMP